MSIQKPNNQMKKIILIITLFSTELIILSCNFQKSETEKRKTEEWRKRSVDSFMRNQQAVELAKQDSIKETAIFPYNQKIIENPKSDKAYYDRGQYYSGIEDYKAAILDFTQAIKLNPKFALAYLERGVSKFKLEDYYGAIQDYDKLIAIDAKAPGVYYFRGICKAELKDHDGAINDLTKEIDLGYELPYKDQVYYNRGIAKYNFGDKKGACLDWSKAGELGSKDAYDRISRYCK